MTGSIRETFEVTMTPQAATDGVGFTGLGRMALDKRYQGELEGVSLGQMMAFRSAVEGSAAYVALEQVVGTLAGKRGTFVLQHSSVMERGVPTQSIRVVPDSGTEQLAGLSGEMRIFIEGAKHYYQFDYTLASVTAS